MFHIAIRPTPGTLMKKDPSKYLTINPNRRITKWQDKQTTYLYGTAEHE